MSQPVKVAPTTAPIRALLDVGRQHARLLAGVALSVPLVVMLVRLAGQHWHPVLDLAMTEFRVRDVGSRNTPLVGLPGRIGRFPEQGSHPGPLSFYLLAPAYRLLGSSAWALLVGAVVVNVLALVTSLWILHRRGGHRAVWFGAALGAVVLRGYGTEVLEQPWNPYLPVLVWVVLLLATWSVLLGDHGLLPVVVVSGSICAQTHIPYLPLTAGMLALLAVAIAAQWRRDREGRRGLRRWLAWSGGIGALLWSPVLVDQLVHDPGNLRMLVDHFATPPEGEQVVGAVEGARIVLRHLDVVRLVELAVSGDEYFVRAGYRLDGGIAVGLIVLSAWFAAAVLSVRRRDRQLVALHVVVGWSLLLAVVSISRAFGKVWYYLTLWCWATTALLVAATFATIAAELRRRGARASVGRRFGVATTSVIGVASLGAFVLDGARAEAPESHLSETLAQLVDPTAAALEAGLGAADGPTGRYTVTYADAANFGSQAYGLVSELERRGFDVGMPETWRVPVTPHRVVPEVEATAQLRLATGSYIDVVTALPGAEVAVLVDPRTNEERARQELLIDTVRASLEANGFDDLVPLLDENLFGLQLDPRVGPDLQVMVDEIIRLGLPTAVVVLPPETGG